METINTSLVVTHTHNYTPQAPHDSFAPSDFHISTSAAVRTDPNNAIASLQMHSTLRVLKERKYSSYGVVLKMPLMSTMAG